MRSLTVLDGIVVFTVLTLLTSVLMVGVLYTGLLAERKRELGLLLAIGMRPSQVIRLIVAEAAVTTGLGGICGVIVGAAGLISFGDPWVSVREQSGSVSFCSPRGYGDGRTTGRRALLRSGNRRRGPPGLVDRAPRSICSRAWGRALMSPLVEVAG